MHYSFRNTLCGLAVVVAAGLLAEQAVAQTVTLVEENETIDLVPMGEGNSAPEEISLFDEQSDSVSLPAGNGLVSPQMPTTSTATDIIPMEGSNSSSVDNGDITISIEDNNIPANSETPQKPRDEMSSNPNATPQVSQKVVSNTSPVVTGKLLGAKSTGGFDENITPSISDELFQRMSDLEKQTTLLNLELKKERVQNEIAAVKAQRLKAQKEEEAKKKEEERKQQEWENEQARLMVAEQTKLKEAEAALEQLRQEKIVKAYKETMLGEIQKWIKINAEAYAIVAQKNAEIKQILDNNTKKFALLKQKAEDLRKKAEDARVAYDKKVANLENQISILKTRLEAEIESSKKKLAEAKAENGKAARRNPFATSTSTTLTSLEPQKTKLSDDYAIMEITGKNDKLAAKLINVDGDIFMVKVGTTLRNGYTIDEINQTYLSAVKDNEKDVLYFSAGGVVEEEPVPSNVNLKDALPDTSDSSNTSANRGRTINATKGIPSLSQGMFIR